MGDFSTLGVSVDKSNSFYLRSLMLATGDPIFGYFLGDYTLALGD